MQLAFAMCADAATVADGKLHVHGGGWSDLMVDRLPATYPGFSVVFALELDGSEPAGRLPLEFTLRALGEIIATTEGMIELPAGHGAGIVTNQVTLTSVPLPRAGSYLVELSCDGRELGGVGFDVHDRRQSPEDELVSRAMADSHAARR